MRLAVFCEQPLNFDGKDYTTDAKIMLMLQFFPRYFGEVSVCVSVNHTKKRGEHLLDLADVWKMGFML